MGNEISLNIFATYQHADAFRLIEAERARQDEKWGEQNHPSLMWQAILAEEAGEVAKACVEFNLTRYERELVEVAAVAVAALESLWRNKEADDGP